MTWLNHALRGLLRWSRDANGQKLVDVSTGMIDGVPISYLLPGTVPATTRAVSGDFKLGVVGVRAEIAYKGDEIAPAALSGNLGVGSKTDTGVSPIMNRTLAGRTNVQSSRQSIQPTSALRLSRRAMLR